MKQVTIVSGCSILPERTHRFVAYLSIGVICACAHGCATKSEPVTREEIQQLQQQVRDLQSENEELRQSRTPHVDRHKTSESDQEDAPAEKAGQEMDVTQGQTYSRSSEEGTSTFIIRSGNQIDWIMNLSNGTEVRHAGTYSLEQDDTMRVLWSNNPERPCYYKRIPGGLEVVGNGIRFSLQD